MNYRHHYHAGGFADVFKHILLIQLIESLKKKPTGFCYVDTHAGIGQYDLLFEGKNKDYLLGIAKLWQQSAPAPIEKYLSLIKEYNHNGELQYYPGSPRLVRDLLRPVDHIIACELHPADYALLQQHFKRDKHVALHHMNGYAALNALLPPQQKRGLVLIDPPFEQPDEFNTISDALKKALKRWPSGIYAIWYPIKNETPIKPFHRAVRTLTVSDILVIEFSIYPKDVIGQLNGCGLMIINPPWQYDKETLSFLPWIWEKLSIDHKGDFTLYLLK